MQINLQWDIILHLLGWLFSKRQQIISVGKDMEKREPLCTVGENVNWCSHYGKQHGGSQNKLLLTTMWHSNFTSWYLSKENKNTNSKVHSLYAPHCSL